MSEVTNKPSYMATAQEVATIFNVRITQGLSHEQVKKNKERVDKRTSVNCPKLPFIFWAIVLVGFSTSVAVFILSEVAGVLLFAGAATLFAVFGLAQQNYVRHILEIIAKYPKATQTVKRDGGSTFQVLPSELVKGDVVILQKGDFVGADMRLIEVNDLVVDEEEVTGTTNAVQKNTFASTKKQKLKDQKNMVFAGSYIVEGKGVAIVVGPIIQPSNFVKVPKLRLKKEQKFRRLIVLIISGFLGASLLLFDIGIFSTAALTILLVASTYYYVTYWLKVTSWASLYEKLLNIGFQANSILAIQNLAKTDIVILNTSKLELLEAAAFVHSLQAELSIEVRGITDTKKEVNDLEQELNIRQSALSEKEFLSSRRDKKLKSLNEYQFLQDFNEIAINETLSLLGQAGHEVLLIDDRKIPEVSTKLSKSYLNLTSTPSSAALKQAAGLYKTPSLKKVVQTFNEIDQFKKTTGY